MSPSQRAVSERLLTSGPCGVAGTPGPADDLPRMTAGPGLCRPAPAVFPFRPPGRELPNSGAPQRPGFRHRSGKPGGVCVLPVRLPGSPALAFELGRLLVAPAGRLDRALRAVAVVVAVAVVGGLDGPRPGRPRTYCRRVYQSGPNATATMQRATATNTRPQRRTGSGSSAARTTGETGTAPTTTARALSARTRRLSPFTPQAPNGADASAGSTGKHPD
ncbi:hypothetical protein KSE_24145 [Kitasatospora setae KM-6054]|uniref:Uncharacterized protein n=1 Tax=Kitasatospora setae (strain ATCC 33774 / DSM 43861 / JCM 3304 / KCC A-0304 / NBRC 14216 / KM-6054) TaxID=452652 RepID=E4NAK1_KITSK|nr:hypothetical protein KSE_24145 [Kitasatospora setae KM-6054]